MRKYFYRKNDDGIILSRFFDEYWDKYKEGLQDIDYTHGQVNPKMWPLGSSNTKGKKVTKKPRKRENG